MTLNLKKSIKKTLPLILGVFLIWLSLSKLTADDIVAIREAIKTANYKWVALSIFLGVLSHLSRAYRWKFMLAPLGYKPKFLNSTMAVFIAYLVNLGIPRAGEVSRAAALSEYEKVPFDKGFGTIVAERVADVIMLLLVMVLALFAQYELIEGLIVKKIPQNPWLLGGIVLILSAIALLVFKWIKKSTHPFIIKIKDFINGLLDGVKTIFTMKKKWAFIFHTCFIWAAYVGMLYVVIYAIPETQNLTINAILVCFIAGALSIAATNGGIGTYPIAIQNVLLLYGVSENIGLSFGWIMWTAQTLMVVFFGGLSFLLLPLYNKNNH